MNHRTCTPSGRLAGPIIFVLSAALIAWMAYVWLDARQVESRPRVQKASVGLSGQASNDSPPARTRDPKPNRTYRGSTGEPIPSSHDQEKLQERPISEEDKQQVRGIVERLRNALDAGDSRAAQGAYQELLAVSEQRLKRPVLKAWAEQQEIAKAVQSLLAERSPDSADFQVVRKRVGELPQDHPFLGHAQTLAARARERLTDVLRQTEPTVSEGCVDLLSEAECWGVSESVRQQFAAGVIKRLKADLPRAKKSVQDDGFDTLEPDRRAKRVSRLEELIEIGGSLATYDPTLDRVLEPARRTLENPGSRQRTWTRPTRRREPVRPDDPASCVYFEWRPVIYTSTSRYSRFLSGVRGTLSNVGKRPIKNVILKIAVRFQGYQDEFAVRVWDSLLEPGETTTWSMRDIGEYLPNSRDPEINVTVHSAAFADSE